MSTPYNGSVECKESMKKSFSTNISHFISEIIQDRASYFMTYFCLLYLNTVSGVKQEVKVI